MKMFLSRSHAASVRQSQVALSIPKVRKGVRLKPVNATEKDCIWKKQTSADYLKYKKIILDKYPDDIQKQSLAYFRSFLIPEEASAMRLHNTGGDIEVRDAVLAYPHHPIHPLTKLGDITYRVSGLLTGAVFDWASKMLADPKVSDDEKKRISLVVKKAIFWEHVQKLMTRGGGDEEDQKRLIPQAQAFYKEFGSIAFETGLTDHHSIALLLKNETLQKDKQKHAVYVYNGSSGGRILHMKNEGDTAFPAHLKAHKYYVKPNKANDLIRALIEAPNSGRTIDSYYVDKERGEIPHYLKDYTDISPSPLHSFYTVPLQLTDGCYMHNLIYAFLDSLDHPGLKNSFLHYIASLDIEPQFRN